MCGLQVIDGHRGQTGKHVFARERAHRQGTTSTAVQSTGTISRKRPRLSLELCRAVAWDGFGGSTVLQDLEKSGEGEALIETVRQITEAGEVSESSENLFTMTLEFALELPRYWQVLIWGEQTNNSRQDEFG